MVYICRCIPARIQHALADLPETLDETYQRTLREIDKANLEFAHRLFQFVAVASRPLRVQELAELLAFDFKSGSIPKFQEDWRLDDPVHAVLSTCSSLLAVVDGGYDSGKVVQFAHFSVKEYLTSTRLAKASDIILHDYHVSMTSAHTIVAQACLGILLHLDKDVVTSDSLEKWPLAEYAAEHWVYHARFEDVSQGAEDGMKLLFHPGKPHFAVWVWICDPESPLWKRNSRPLPPSGAPLHYAALWGLHSIVEFLIIEHSQDVHGRGFTDNVTPLHLASKRGHVKAARMLIKHGADVIAQNEDGNTPLHLASQENQVEIARMLVEFGADVAAQNNHGETPLHQASFSGQLEITDMLIEHGADVATRNSHGETPLHHASFSGRVEVAGMLIERNADVTAQNSHGDTPLHLALIQEQLEVAHMLLERGADVKVQNSRGETPLVSAQNKDEETPLHLASRKGQVEVAHILILYGADVTAQDQDGMTPLHLASFQGHEEVAGLLIEHSADMTAQNKYGLTPLHLASQEGQVDVTCLLIECGADLMT